MTLYTIKKLKWKQDTVTYGWLSCKTIFGYVYIENVSDYDNDDDNSDETKIGGWVYRYTFEEYYDEETVGEFKTREKAKEAAEKFYLSRLKKALTKVKSTK